MIFSSISRLLFCIYFFGSILLQVVIAVMVTVTFANETRNKKESVYNSFEPITGELL